MRDQFLESNMPPFQGSISPTFEHLCSMATMSDPSRTFAKSPAPKVQQDEGTHILGHQGTFKQEPSRNFFTEGSEPQRRGWKPVKRIRAKADQHEERKLPKLLSAKIEQASSNILKLCDELASTMSQRYGVFPVKRPLLGPISFSDNPSAVSGSGTATGSPRSSDRFSGPFPPRAPPRPRTSGRRR